MIIKVKRIEPDHDTRPRLQNIETKAIYADISLGDAEKRPEFYKELVGHWEKLNIPGDWCSTSKDGEPSYPLKQEVVFRLITDNKKELNR